MAYRHGNGVERSPEKAFHWFKEASAAGGQYSLYRVAMAYLMGDGVVECPSKAFPYLLASARQGHPKARYEVAMCYANGIGTEKNYRESVRWLHVVAQLGDPGCSPKVYYALGRASYYGNGCAKSETIGVQWFRKGAKRGHARCIYEMGLAYKLGKGVTPDPVQAQDWFERGAGAGAGNVRCMYEVGRIYGFGGEKDMDKAVRWYTKAAEQGCLRSQYNLGTIYCNGVGGDGG